MSGQSSSEHRPPILPVGTAVVTRVAVRSSGGVPVHPPGETGVIVRAPANPAHPYQVRFPGGDQATLKRLDLHVLKHFQRPGFDTKAGGHTIRPDRMTDYDLWQHLIYRCLIGSRAYGLAHGESNADRRGIYLPPARMHWSIYGVPEQLENPDTQEC